MSDKKNKRIEDIIKEYDQAFEKKLEAVANDILSKKDIRLVRLSGPTCSGKTTAAAMLVKAFEKAGAFAIVLECVSRSAAIEITKNLSIPTIGIGSGPECSGQVQVFHDIIGMFDGFTPKHSRRYAEAGKVITDALASYAREVREGAFPGDENSF